VLLDSTMVGSYYYKPKSGSLKLVGHLMSDNKFELVERDSKERNTGYFKGQLNNNNNNEVAEGKWISGDKNREYSFFIKQIHGNSYWDYIKKFRSLNEYNDIDLAISEADNVVSIDVASQNIDNLPSDFKRLKYVVSVNLLGNKFESFPIVLTELKQLEEISLSSNQVKYVGQEIGRLTNLRILIMNNNKLKSLPSELGQLENLLYLELGNNQLTSLPDEIKELTKLQELHIERNQLTEDEKQRIKKSLPNCVIHF
jgi:Leucine-rich repeat (LRR) protein